MLVGTTVVPGAEGEVIAFVLDLSANQSASREVERLRDVRSEAMFRGLLEAAPDAVVIDTSGEAKVIADVASTPNATAVIRVNRSGSATAACSMARASNG